MGDNQYYKTLFLDYTEGLFSELVEFSLIHPESSFLQQTSRKLWQTYLSQLAPIAEFLEGTLDPNSEFFLYSCWLFAYGFFLDYSIDQPDFVSSRRVRATQISSYSLIKYFSWISNCSSLDDIEEVFFNYFQHQSQYLNLEKKWAFPNLYTSVYGSKQVIFAKAILLFFPFEVLKRRNILSEADFKSLINIFRDYYSFILLCDDIFDLDEDIQNECLTYPVSVYYKHKRKLPCSSKDVLSISFADTLMSFKRNILHYQAVWDRSSSILKNRLSTLENKLERKGISL